MERNNAELEEREKGKRLTKGRVFDNDVRIDIIVSATIKYIYYRIYKNKKIIFEKD